MEQERERARMGDFIRFLAEMQRQTYETYRQRLRDIGLQGGDGEHGLVRRRAGRLGGQPLDRRRHGRHRPAQLLRRRGRAGTASPRAR